MYKASGEYVPKSVYLIDEDGSTSLPIHVRNRRDLEQILSRIRRGGGAYSYSGSSSSNDFSGGFAGPPPELAQLQSDIQDIAQRTSNIQHEVLSHVQNIAASHPAGANSGSYSYSGSSGNSGGYGGGSGGHGGSGPSGGYRSAPSGGYGSGGSSGPSLFSRSGVEKGSGIKVSSAAQGPNAAFSYSSSASDGQGNVKYNVKSGQY
ncbi:keratin, type I cytoskeletal 9 isoform X2 [Diabrotica virgifera virgifera]|uniref:Keratin, type I cytoskeletal 9-like n=1 Tax=Diabrotica virgifera virgifera TaxID=50390 RepID=A0ABM5JTH7_DIAVI|nr:keratin, type I cytoskeletal 9 isoform X2 [Diabrotica virgifera virgifera]